MHYEIIPITETPVTLERAKKHLQLESDFTDDDELIQGCIDGAVSDREGYLDRELYEQRVYYPSAFCGFDMEAWADASATVEYAVPNEDEGVDYETLPSENYIFRKLGASTCRIDFRGELPVLPSVARPVRITVNTTCPKAVVAAILLVIGDLYERREDRGGVGNNSAANNLCRNFRKYA